MGRNSSTFQIPWTADSISHLFYDDIRHWLLLQLFLQEPWASLSLNPYKFKFPITLHRIDPI